MNIYVVIRVEDNEIECIYQEKSKAELFIKDQFEIENGYYDENEVEDYFTIEEHVLKT